jgi:hypothetical protein
MGTVVISLHPNRACSTIEQNPAASRYQTTFFQNLSSRWPTTIL